MRLQPTAAALLAGLLLAACGSQPVDPSQIARPTGEGELVLRVETVGGLLPPLEAERALPSISIYGDGLVLVPGAVDASFPGPSGYPLEAFRIDGATLDRILAAASDAGLQGPDRRIEQEGPDFVVDGGATVITVISGAAQHVTTADALFDVDANTPERAALSALVADLNELRPLADEVTTYEPLSVAVYLGPFDDSMMPDPGLLNRSPWPLEGPLAEFGEAMEPEGMSVDVRCAVVSGAELEELLPFLTAANSATLAVDAGGDERQVAWRPLLPDETGC